jgi:hypothetical protein
MDGGKSEAALSRIEAALARVEAVVRRRDVIGGSGDLADCEERHQRLRDVVHRSLEQLDDLIALQAGTAE